MTPREVLEQWIVLFNQADADGLSALYSEDAINHQVANEMIVGREAIHQMFAFEFSHAEMVCIPENIFEDGDWVILEWRDPNTLRGCGFFQIIHDQIVFQRGYWDKLTFYKLQGIPISLD